MADNKEAEPKSGNDVAVPATDDAAATQKATDQKKMDDQARIREILAKKKAREEAAAAAAAEATAANKVSSSNVDDNNNASENKTEKSAEEESSSKPSGVDDEARLREMLSKKKIMNKKNRRASKGEDPTSETAGRNEGNDADKKPHHHSNGHRRHEDGSRGGGRDYRRDRPHHGRGGYYDDRRRDDHRGWRNNNDRGGYGRGRDNYWDSRGRGGGWRDERRDYGGRGGYHHQPDFSARDRSRGRSRSRSFSRSSSGSRSRSYSSDGSRSSGSYSSRSHSRSYSRSASRSPSRDSSTQDDKKRKRSDSVGDSNEKKKHRRSSSKSKSDAENALTKDQRTVLVSQLVMKADDYDIRRYFKRKVGVKVNDVILLRDKRTGRHKGIAYVELGNLEDVDTALEVSGKTPDFQRFPILVKRTEAEKNAAGISVAASSDSPYQLTADGKRIEAQKVYVGSIDRAVTQAQLYSLFSQFGKLDNVLLQMDMATGISKGFAFLSYPDPKDANLAIQTMSGQMLAGRPLKTGWANQQSSAAGIQEVRSDEFPTDSNEKIEKVNQVLIQLTGSGLTTMLSHVDPAQQQALLAAGPAGALGILPSAQLASVADAALDVALGNIPSSGALSPVPVSAGIAVAATATTAPAAPPAIGTASTAATTETSNADDAKVVGRIDRPSNHILVHNMFNKDEETEQGWEEDIKLDFEEECAQYGKIYSVVVMSKEIGGKIYATFDSVDGAMNCAKNLAGRWFDKRQLRVEFVDSIP